MALPTIDDCRFLEIPSFTGEVGTLRAIEDGAGQLPFTLNRMFIISDVPEQAVRAAHSPWKTNELLFAVNGSFDLELDDGKRAEKFLIDDPGRPFYLPCGIWRRLTGFTPGAFCIVLANGNYDENEYETDYQSYVRKVELAAQ